MADDTRSYRTGILEQVDRKDCSGVELLSRDVGAFWGGASQVPDDSCDSLQEAELLPPLHGLSSGIASSLTVAGRRGSGPVAGASVGLVVAVVLTTVFGGQGACSMASVLILI